MIPNGETYSKDTMRGIFSNPKKNFFNFLTFGKNPKVQPSMVLRRIFLSKGFSSVFNGWIRIFFNDRLIIGGDDSRSNWVSREVFRRETETKKTTTTIQRCPCFIFFQILYSILQQWKFLQKRTPKNGKTKISTKIMLLSDGDGDERIGLG